MLDGVSEASLENIGKREIKVARWGTTKKKKKKKKVEPQIHPFCRSRGSASRGKKSADRIIKCNC
jgi:hypothetical protein